MARRNNAGNIAGSTTGNNWQFSPAVLSRSTAGRYCPILTGAKSDKGAETRQSWQVTAPNMRVAWQALGSYMVHNRKSK
ncbi:hypothetical protein [Trueperella sp. LYQ143]|uniref:hypothetical protein n=1 Tax=Trueperella sp. LYQ143 TaxID=3391059 RepID=UPI003982DBB2